MDPAVLSQWKKRGFIKLYHYGYQTEVKLAYGMAEDALRYQKYKTGRKIDCIMFHGINDEAVPYQLSIEYLQRNPNTSLWLLNTDHGMLDKLEELWQHLLPFLEFNSK
jgi:hypothetical protein